MAIRHGLAGKYGKTEATQRQLRSILFLIIFGGCFFTAIGFALGYFWARPEWGQLLAIIPMVAMWALFIAVWPRAERSLDKNARERIHFMRSGEAEGLNAWTLEGLDDDWHVFNGIKLEAESDIDHIVVGPGGVYCISTKSHRGLFEGTPDGLLHNRRPSPFAREAMRQTMNLKDRLFHGMGNNVPWLQPVLAVPYGYDEGDACGGKVWLVNQETILDRLGRESAPARLDKQQIRRTVTALETIQVNAAAIYERLVTELSASDKTAPAAALGASADSIGGGRPRRAS